MGALSAWQEGGPWESGRRMRPTGLGTKYKTQHKSTKYKTQHKNTKYKTQHRNTKYKTQHRNTKYKTQHRNKNTKCDMEIQNITSSWPPPHPRTLFKENNDKLGNTHHFPGNSVDPHLVHLATLMV